jgi:hypothetical protein
MKLLIISNKKLPTNIPIEEIIHQKTWQDIHPSFNYLMRKDWENKGFAYEETKIWIRLGFKPNAYRAVENEKKILIFKELKNY